MTCARRLAGAHRPAPSVPAASSRPERRSGRSRARLFRLLPVLALLLGALSPFAAAPAAADVLVSNIGQAAITAKSLSVINSQAFTTGSHADGYTLTNIEFGLTANSPTAAHLASIRAELWSDNGSGRPGSNIASLTVPSSISSGNVAFAAPGGTTLAASTTYHVVLYSTGTGRATTQIYVRRTSAAGEDSGAAVGWSIADKGLSSQIGDADPATANWVAPDHARRIRVNGAAVEATGPDAPTFDPDDGTTTTNAAGNIKLTFAEAIKSDASATDFTATALKNILTLAEDDENGTAIPFSASIDAEKKVVTIDPTSNLSDGVVYVAVSDAWYDAEGNQGAAANATFTVDATAPSVTFSPGDGDTVTDASGNITLTFTEPIKSDSSGADFDNSDIDDILTLKAGSSAGSDITFDATIDATKRIVTINPASDLPTGDVYVAVSGSHWDAHGNQGAATSATFTVGAAAAPDPPSFLPANGTTVTLPRTDITLTFDEAIKRTADGADFSGSTQLKTILTLKIGNASGTNIAYAAAINSEKTVITIDPSGVLSDGAVYVAVSDAWYDGDGNQGAAAEATFTVDSTGPSASFSPGDGDTVTNAAGNITLTFDEAIKSDASATDFSNTTIDGILTLKKGSSAGEAIGFDATIDGAMKVVTINPSSNLEEGDVYVAVSSSYWDAHGNQGSAMSATFEVDALSSDATLSTLTGTTSTDGSTFDGTLAIENFSGTKTDYEVTVGNAVTHAKLTPTVNHSGAGVKVGKGASLTTVTSGQASAAIPLAVGANALKVEVTAEDEMTETYTVTVKRRFAMPTNLAASGDGKLDLTWTAPTGGTLTGYDVHYTASTTVADDAEAGTNVATEWVDAAHAGTTAEDEITGLTNGTEYRLRVRAKNADVEGEWAFDTATPKSSDATLSGLSGSTSTDGSDFSGTLDIGTFSATTTAYTADVEGSVTHVKLTPEVNDSDAKVKVGKQGGTLNAVTSGQASAAIALDPGANPIDVEVTAEDESVQTYTVTVTRLSVPSGVSVAPGAAGGTPTLAVTFGATPSGWVAAHQVKLASEEWPARTAQHTAPSGVLIDSGLSTGTQSGGTIVWGTGLQKDTAYDVRVHLYHATSGEIIEASSTPIQVTTWTVPGAPTAVTATAASSSALNAGWTAPTETGGTGADITGYKVRWREKDTAPHTAGDQAGAWNAEDGVTADSATAHAISGLESNTAYEVELRALNGIDPGSAWSVAGTGMTALPLGVSWSASLRVQATGSSRVGCDNGVTGKQCSTGTVLTEDDFTVNGRSYSVTRIRYITSGVLAVRLTRGPDAALGALSLCIGADAAFPLTGQNSELTFTGTGLGWSAGDTVPLRIATSCAAGAPTVPDQPAELAVTPDDGRLDLRWRAPPGSVSGYDVHYTSSTTVGDDADVGSNTDAATGWVAVSRTESDPPPASQSITGLTNGTPYRVRVRAKNAIGDGEWARQTATPAVPVAPSVPRSVTVTPGDGKLTMSWEAPASPGTWPASAYFVQWKLSSAGATDWGFVMRDNEVVGIGADDTGFVFTGPQADGGGDPYTVTNGTAYDLRIQAISQKPGGSNPDTDLLRSGWVAVTDSTPTADAVPPPAPPAPPGAVWSATLTVDAASGAFGCDNFDAGQANCSDALTEDAFTYPDGGPTYTVTALYFVSGHNFLHVQFDRAVPAGRLYLNVGDRQFDSDDAGVSDNRLTGNVWQWASAGLTWTDGQKVTLSLSPSNLPDAPTGLAVTPGDGTLDLAWTAPPGPVTGYDVHYTSSAGAGDDDAASGSDPAAGWVAVSRTETDPPTASQSVSGLTNDAAYRLRVRGRNAHGDGAWARGTGTPAAVPLDPPSPAPGAIWSARLTVQPESLQILKDFGPELASFGCFDDAVGFDRPDGATAFPNPAAYCEPGGALSDDDFTFAGVSYEIDKITDNGRHGSRFDLVLDKPVTSDSLRNPLQLRIKGSGAGSADLTLPLVDARPTVQEDRGSGLAYYGLSWRNLNIPNWKVGSRFSVSLERVQPWVSLQKVDRMLRVLWTMPGEGTVSGWDVHYTASSSVAGDAPAGADPATGWVDTDSTGTEGIHEIGGLENGTEYRVRVRARWAGLGAGGADILSPWGFRAGAPEKVPPSRLTPDPNFLTGITFNDGVQDLPVEPNIANAVGFGGPGWYVVHVPPGVRSVTVKPVWTNEDVDGVNMWVKNITLSKEQPDDTDEWEDDESGDGKAVTMGEGLGSVRVTLVVGTTSGSSFAQVTYRFLLSHNNAWKSADDRLDRLELEIGN